MEFDQPSIFIEALMPLFTQLIKEKFGSLIVKAFETQINRYFWGFTGEAKSNSVKFDERIKIVKI